MKNKKEKLLIVGDVHVNFESFVKHINKAIDKHGQFKYIIQLGDFGYWPNLFNFEKRYLDRHLVIKNYFDNSETPLLWVDGNHEDHSILQKVENFNESEHNMFGQNVFYKERGSWLELDKHVLFFIGGANSIDKHIRTENIDWFKEEEVSYGQSVKILKKAEKLKEVGKPIVVFSHTMPYDGHFDSIMRIYKKGCSFQNKFMFEILKTLQPVKWYHGHYHIDQEYEIKGFDTKIFSVDLVNDKTFGFKVLEL
jgi:Icc-related predicted phosphoesterase